MRAGRLTAPGCGTTTSAFAPGRLPSDSNYNRPESSSSWQTVVADPGFDNLFASAVYDRGAATLFLLHEMMGDEAFFELAQTWIDTYNDSSATTEDFTALAEKASGLDLDAFFQAWLYTAGEP